MPKKVPCPEIIKWIIAKYELETLIAIERKLQ